MRKFLLFSAFLCLTSCWYGSDTQKRIIGNYYLLATDNHEDLDLAYQDPTNESFYTPIVEATVFAEGNNKEYIIIKQHPGNDRKVINYFILPISKKIGTINNFGLMGPLTLEKFNQKKKKLKIEKLDFTIVYRDLE